MSEKRDDLIKNKKVELCPHCDKSPYFTQIQGSKFVILLHHCDVVNAEIISFPSDVQKSIDSWNHLVTKSEHHFNSSFNIRRVNVIGDLGLGQVDRSSEGNGRTLQTAN